MRILILTSLFFSIFFFAPSIYAQGKSADAPKAAQKTEEKDIFTNASNKHIRESQIFYESCTENKIMNERKNCKCATDIQFPINTDFPRGEIIICQHFLIT